MNGEARIIEPGQIEIPAGEIRHLILPKRDLFNHRAERFRYLASCHPLGDYFAFLAIVADSQQAALNRFATLPQLDNELAECRKHGMPLLCAHSWPRHPAWREGLSMILQKLEKAVLPEAAREAIADLQQASEASLEKMADRILAGDLGEVPPRELPLVAAALQVYWLQMATSLGENAFGRLEHGGLCPVCGSYPNIGVVGSSDSRPGLRYLCCSLCASQWHFVRIKCSCCESTSGISHYSMEGANGAIKAESCDDCGSYLKLLCLEKDPQMDAMADDLATLSLDILMDKEGKSRGGPNLLFHPGMV